MKLFVWKVNEDFDQSILVAMAENEEDAIGVLIEEAEDSEEQNGVLDVVKTVQPKVYDNPKAIIAWRRQ